MLSFVHETMKMAMRRDNRKDRNMGALPEVRDDPPAHSRSASDTANALSRPSPAQLERERLARRLPRVKQRAQISHQAHETRRVEMKNYSRPESLRCAFNQTRPVPVAR